MRWEQKTPKKPLQRVQMVKATVLLKENRNCGLWDYSKLHLNSKVFHEKKLDNKNQYSLDYMVRKQSGK